MLGYEWSTQSPPPPQLIVGVTDDINHHHHHDHHRPIIFNDPFLTPYTFPVHDNNPAYLPLYDHALPGPTGYQQVMVPKPDPENPNPIGLNLGGRTYFAAADDDFVSRLYRRGRVAEAVVNSPKCQVEGCNADLSHGKHYHRRHKVCEYHSKAATVVAAGFTQRFCQQCSRFHMLSEFDNGKRSCRKRLADHNRRRRKSNQSQTVNLDHHPETALMTTSLSQIAGSPSNSGANSSSSVTVAVSSPPLASSDSGFRPNKLF